MHTIEKLRQPKQILGSHAAILFYKYMWISINSTVLQLFVLVDIHMYVSIGLLVIILCRYHATTQL